MIRTICDVFCGKRPPMTSEKQRRIVMPSEVREASHNVANAAAEIQGASNRAVREMQIFVELSEALQKRGRANRGSS